MSVGERTLVVYVDVDDTLVRSFGSKQIPMTRSIERIRELCQAPAVEAYCWSSGGGEYARGVAQSLGIEDLFLAFLPKPQLMVDDQNLDRWSELLVLHPNEAVSTTETEIRRRLGWDP